jgi:GMP synthase (glutamine-hydrolysing)
MKKLLIVKTGTSFPAIIKNHGDFEDFILRQIGIQPKEVLVSAVYKKEPLPEFGLIAAVIITGSPAMVTNHDEWSLHLASWLRQFERGPVPVLGICYGHQLLAAAFGGTVGYHRRGREIGTVPVELTGAGEADLLLGKLPKTFPGHVFHAQTVTVLPANSRLLAANNFEQHQAFSLRSRIWGVQFHPEFTAEIIRAYIQEEKETLWQEGDDPENLSASVRENPYGKLLLQRFMALI